MGVALTVHETIVSLNAFIPTRLMPTRRNVSFVIVTNFANPRRNSNELTKRYIKGALEKWLYYNEQGKKEMNDNQVFL